MALDDATRASFHMPPSALDYANAAHSALNGVDPATLTETDRLLYALAAAALSIASSATGLDKLDAISNQVGQLVTYTAG